MYTPPTPNVLRKVPESLMHMFSPSELQQLLGMLAQSSTLTHEIRLHNFSVAEHVLLVNAMGGHVLIW